MADQRLLNIRQLAQRTGISVPTLRRWKNQKLIPFFQPGGPRTSVRFPADAIEMAHHLSSPVGQTGAPPPELQEQSALVGSPLTHSLAGHEQTMEEPRRYGPSPRWTRATPRR